MFHRLWKPWFIHRPTQIWRRARAAMRPPQPGYRALMTSWGIALTADPSRTIGRNIVTTGLYDIAVSEALVRLIVPGSTVIDAGANVGYMSVLMALAAGPEGKVVAFEPHPELVKILQTNVQSAAQQQAIAPIDVHEAALGETAGTAELIIPDAFGGNDGIASLVDEMVGPGRRVQVTLVTLDQVIGDAEIAVMKIDVEGFELQALRGGIEALRAHRIRHVVFEDFHAGESQVMRLFESLGYRIYEIGWTVERLALAPFGSKSVGNVNEAPNFVATIDPEALLSRCAASGWKVLSPSLR